VVLERNLDWMAAVLAVFKAGGVYLPVEPHFPADRVARVLDRAGCELVLTEHGSDGSLDVVRAHALRRRRVRRGPLGRRPRDPGRAGPTRLHLLHVRLHGGAQGRHVRARGFLNHVFAKLDDLGIGAGQVVAQTAPQCFDISLWQLVCAPLVGGRTLLVEQDVILDVPRFVDTIEAGPRQRAPGRAVVSGGRAGRVGAAAA
jgi:non-ribosomal peptide synthetase component F